MAIQNSDISLAMTTLGLVPFGPNVWVWEGNHGAMCATFQSGYIKVEWLQKDKAKDVMFLDRLPEDLLTFGQWVQFYRSGRKIGGQGTLGYTT